MRRSPQGPWRSILVKRFLFLSFWSMIYVIATAFVAVAAVVGIFDLHIGPVVWAWNDTHGIHAGDVVITAIATFLVLLFTIGIVLAHRQP